jgi:hypothetical protein
VSHKAWKRSVAIPFLLPGLGKILPSISQGQAGSEQSKNHRDYEVGTTEERTLVSAAGLGEGQSAPTCQGEGRAVLELVQSCGGLAERTKLPGPPLLSFQIGLEKEQLC